MKLKQKIRYIASLCAVLAAFAISAYAADGGIVEVDTRLNVRTEPSIASAVKDRLWDGQLITLHERHGDFWYIEYAPEKYGYVAASYVNELSLCSGRVSTVSSTLNVREGASTSAGIKDKLPKGKEVLILGTYGDFYKILYDGNLVGYAAKQYISTSVSAEGSMREIRLNVKSYKQYDRAYSSLRLPGSNESVYTHGCAVTSLAITESYRTGETVTPKTVIENERFTAGGALYWPAVYSSSGISLSEVYNSLSLGKPVIVHVKNARGGGHFAVICGYTGDGLSASSFIISDPGSATRKTLADLYSAYPIGVKILTY